MAPTGRYLYAITRGLEPAALEGVAGLSGGRLETVAHRGLVAVVSTVDLDEYGEQGLRRNLERMDWLEETAREHNTVVQAVGAHGPTAPMRLATICLDDAGVRQRLEEWEGPLTTVLDRVEGRAEWSVKLFARPEPAPPTPEEQAPAAAGGAAYLLRKKQQTQARQQRHATAAELAQQVYDGLARHAVAARQLAPQDPRLTGEPDPMVLNAAYLVPHGSADDFTAAVAALESAHPQAAFRLAGPWTPYSFATLEA